MVDNNHAANPSSAQTTGEPAKAGNAVPATASTEAENQAPTLEQFQALQKQLNSVAGQLRTLAQAQQPAQQKQQANEPGNVQEEISKLRSEFKAEREEVARDRRSAAIEKAIASVSKELSDTELFTDHLMQRYGDKIVVDGKKVVYRDPVTAEEQSVSSFVESLLKGSGGDRFKAASNPPSSKTLRSSSASVGSSKRFSEMTLDERMKLPQAERWALANKEMTGG